jgi:hypothetical protein
MYTFLDEFACENFCHSGDCNDDILAYGNTSELANQLKNDELYKFSYRPFDQITRRIIDFGKLARRMASYRSNCSWVKFERRILENFYVKFIFFLFRIHTNCSFSRVNSSSSFDFIWTGCTSSSSSKSSSA